MVLNIWLGVALILCAIYGVRQGYKQDPDCVDDLEANLLTALTWPGFMGVLVGMLIGKVHNILRGRRL